MRKILLATIVIFCLFCGCKKQCVQPYQSDEIPALKTNDFNSCEAVCKNYTYLICGDEASFPYCSHIKDTIMVCGYISNWDGESLLLPLFDSPEPSNPEFCVYVELYNYPIVEEEINVSKKCYVRGRLFFNSLYTNGGPYYMVPVIGDVQELFFE